MVVLKGSTREKWAFEIFCFGYGIASNDKMVPDPVGSGCYGIHAPARDHNRNRPASSFRRRLRGFLYYI